MKAIPTFIRERGFRKWYEHELVTSHSHLVLLLLCTLALLGALEAYSQREGVGWTLVLAFAVAGLLGAWAMRRYVFHLMRAESVANQAVCPRCQAYARWRIDSDEPPEGDRGPVLVVHCRDCGERWRIEC